MKSFLKLLSISFILFSLYGITYAQEQSRQKYAINSNWYFHKGELDQSQLNTADKDLFEVISLPHTYNAMDILDDEPGYYRGTAWYMKKINFPENAGNKEIYIYFEGANQDVNVYVNDQLAGTHLGGYTAFSFNIGSYINPGEENIIKVEISNAHNEDVAPLAGDLCHFGGIYRDVWIIEANKLHIDLDNYASSGVFLTTPEVDSSAASLTIKGKIRNSSAKKEKLLVRNIISDPKGKTILTKDSKIILDADSEAEFEQQIKKIENPLLWSPENPNLYSVKTQLVSKQGEILDEVINPLGFRWFSADADKGFFLNGKHYFLKGVGKHQDFKDMGYAVPNEILINDVIMMKDMGVNMVRCHYPQDPAVNQACDIYGMIRVGRIPILDRISFSKAWVENVKTSLTEMILQGYNNPSVFLWEYMNEVFGDMDWYWEKPRDPEKVELQKKKTYELAKYFEDHVRELDPGRLTTMVFHTSENPQWYKEAGLTNLSHINGWNIYMGWYHVNMDNTGNALDEFRAYNPELPYILTEFGAGSDPRIHTYQPSIFDNSIEYQVKLHKKYLEEVSKRSYIAGMSPWTFVDFQVESRQDAVPHINSKGLLTSDRKKKDAFWIYKSAWSDEAFVQISGKSWNQRIEINETDKNPVRQIEVFSNLPEAELFLNNVSQGVKSRGDHGFIWDITPKEGKNQLLAIAKDGEQSIADFAEMEFIFISDLSEDFGKLPGQKLCINVGQSRTILMQEEGNNYWLSDRNYSNQLFGHQNGNYYRNWPGMPSWDGIREGISSNIKNTDLDPVYQTFLVGAEDYQLDLPEGNYTLSLMFAEPFPIEKRMDPEAETGAGKDGSRVFDIVVNGRTLMENINLAENYGVQRAVKFKYQVKSNGNGIHIQLKAVKGEPVLSGIMIEKGL